MDNIFIISGHQPNFLPYPGFFKKILMSDAFVYITKVQFNKKSWQNRNRIINQNRIDWLTVPVLTKNRYEQKIKDVRINNDFNWQRKHFRSIYMNYHNCEFFSQIEELLDIVYNKKRWNFLVDLDIFITNYLIDLLGIKVPIFYDFDYEFDGTKTDLLISICNNFGAKAYLSNTGSSAYVDLSIFQKNDIMHFYMSYNSPIYEQNSQVFFENLSILDMIANCGIEKTVFYLNLEKFYYYDVKNYI